MSVCRLGLLRFEKVTNLITNSSLQIVLAKLGVLVYWLNLHETRTGSYSGPEGTMKVSLPDAFRPRKINVNGR